MTQVDFYILPDTSADARWLFACRLIEKAHKLGHRILVAVDNQEQARELDDLLWSFKPESFVPHSLLEGAEATPAPVAITWSNACGAHQDVLINLGQTVPEYFSRFERLSEVVIQEPQVLQTTREHYNFYRQRGYPIQHRNLAQSSGS